MVKKPFDDVPPAFGYTRARRLHMPKLGGYLVSFAQALRIGVRDGQLTISLFRGSHTMRKVRVSIVIPLLTLALQDCSWMGGDGRAARARRLSGTTVQHALTLVSVAVQCINFGTNAPPV